ncbi:MAG: hypothetical protein M3N50_04085 [Pseudomonadota bacterium]|nr:hypothetical protein [Pseudomonadota bacterium]
MLLIPDTREALRREAGRIQESGVLGEARLRKLFDYLLAQSLEGLSPKEIAIAIDVFGKGSQFDVSQDALVRVYIHKLRRTLEDFYAGAGANGGAALHIPRGEYRLTVSSAASLANQPKPRRRVALAASLAAGAAALLVGTVVWLHTPHTDIERIRATPIWSWVLSDDRPIMVIVGDYYLIGETDESMEVKRLVREYAVNSKSDLDNYVKQHPEVADRYIDVGLRYLPTAAAFALRDVMPVIATGNRRILVSMMSDVNPATLKAVNIVYIGYLGEMGILRDLVFRGSRFTLGDSYDELVDRKTQHRYISQTASQNMGAAKSSGLDSAYRDYGFFSAIRGPGGNNIVVIAGTRDEGVRQTAETFTNSAKLHDLGAQGDLAAPFEALLEVSALDGVNLTGKLLLTSKLDAPLAPCPACDPPRN